MLLRVLFECPPNLHAFDFSNVPTSGVFAQLCHCEKAIATGANGIVRVEVLL